jgi:hypothetical protein
MVGPGPTVGQPRMQPVPAGRDRPAVVAGRGACGPCRLGPGGQLVQRELGAVAGWAADGAGPARRCGPAEDPVRAQPPGQLDGQIIEHERQPGDLVAGRGDDQDGRFPGAPVPGGGQPPHHGTQLGGGDRGGVLGGPEPDRVQHRRPRRAPRFQSGDERVGPARDQLAVALPAPVDMAEQPLRTGRGVRAQPRADVDGEHEPAVGGPGQRQRGQRPAQPRRFHPTLIERVVHRAVPAAVLGHQRQLHQRAARAVGAQHRIGQLEQHIGSRRARPVELLAEPAELTPTGRDVTLPVDPGMRHTGHRGHRLRL